MKFLGQFRKVLLSIPKLVSEGDLSAPAFQPYTWLYVGNYFILDVKVSSKVVYPACAARI